MTTPLADTSTQAIQIVANGTNDAHGVVSPTIAKVTGVQTLSVYLRRSGEVPAFTQAVGLNSFIVVGNFNLLDGSFGSKGVGVSTLSIQTAGNGWLRCSVTFNNLDVNQLDVHIFN
jgi:hypothetical protein